MHAAPARIAVILPPREGFSPQQFGAVSLCVKDFAQYSRFKDETIIYGAFAHQSPFPHVHYQPLPIHRHWYEPLRRAYLRAILQVITPETQLIEVHNRPSLARKLAQRTAVPVALHVHNDPLEMRRARTAAERSELLSLCAGIYCISDFVRHRFLQDVPLYHHKAHVIYPGYDLPHNPPPAKQKEILFVGRLTPNKGGDLFAAAMATLLPDYPDWKAVMVGGRRHSVSQAPDAFERGIRDHFTALGRQGEFLGFQSHEETMGAFTRAAIAVIPSVWDEAFGRTALEAAAHGCAIITSGRGGLKEITANAAITLAELTPQAIAAALRPLLDDPALLRQYATNAHQRAGKFSNNACAAALDQVREHIIHQS